MGAQRYDKWGRSSISMLRLFPSVRMGSSHRNSRRERKEDRSSSFREKPLHEYREGMTQTVLIPSAFLIRKWMRKTHVSSCHNYGRFRMRYVFDPASLLSTENPRNVLRFDRAWVYEAAEWICGVFGGYVLCFGPITVIAMVQCYRAFFFHFTYYEPRNVPRVQIIAYCCS